MRIPLEINKDLFMTNKIDPMSLSRRKLLLGAGAVGATSVLGLGSKAFAADEPVHWDHQADILCIGSGAAAGTAAAIAASRGASVIVVEKMPIPGGTTAKSGGVAWIPNHHILRNNGITDNRDDCLRYMARFAYPNRYDRDSETLGLDRNTFDLLAAFYDNGAKMVEAMEKIGALTFKQFKMWGADTEAPDYADHLPENKANNVRALEVAAGSYSGGGGFSGGRDMVYQIEQWLNKHNVPILFEHKVIGLIKDNDRVIGVQVKNNDQLLHIKAHKAVIFGTGGYSHNPAFIDLHQPALYGSCAAGSATGDFIAIAQEAGAQMGDLTTAWRTPVVFEQVMENREVPLGVYFTPGDSMIHVNKYGKRIFNEKRNYNDRTRTHFVFDPVNAEYPNMLMFMIFDERTLNRYSGAYPLAADKRQTPWLIEGADIAELSKNIEERLKKWQHRIGSYRLDEAFAKNLDASIERFNHFAETGRDDDFDRGRHQYDRAWMKLFSQVNPETTYPENDKPNSTMYPLDRSGRLYGVILAPGSLDTSGGPAINANSQVLSASGAPITGLYGAGNCVASATGPAYMGAGGTIGPAMTFGYIAALHGLGHSL